MRTRTLASILFPALLATLNPAHARPGSPEPPKEDARCLTDDEVGADERALYEGVALIFVETLVRRNADELRGVLPRNLQNAQAIESLVAHLETLPDFQSVKVAHSYSAKVAPPFALDFIPCTAVARGDSAAQENLVYLKSAHVPMQSLVLVEAVAEDSVWTFTIALLPRDMSWEVATFHFSASRMMGRSAEDFHALAQREADAGHAFNATVLFDLSLRMMYWGKSFVTGASSQLRTALRDRARPAGLETDNIHSMTIDGRDYTIQHIGGFVAKDKLMLRYVQSVNSREEAEAANRALIAGVRATNREYVAVFDGIMAEAVTPDGFAVRTFDLVTPR